MWCSAWHLVWNLSRLIHELTRNSWHAIEASTWLLKHVELIANARLAGRLLATVESSSHLVGASFKWILLWCLRCLADVADSCNQVLLIDLIGATTDATFDAETT